MLLYATNKFCKQAILICKSCSLLKETNMVWLISGTRWSNNKTLNPSIFNIIRWVAVSMEGTSHQPSVWCSKHYFFHNFLFFRVIEKKWMKMFFVKNFARNHQKKKPNQHIILEIVGFFGRSQKFVLYEKPLNYQNVV